MGDLVKIILNDDTVEISKKGIITGEIYFQLSETTFFPIINWNDFIVVILTWWNKSANMLVASPVGATVNFSFMDGPFNIMGKKGAGDRIILTFTRRNSSIDEVLYIIEVDSLALRSSILEVSRRVLNIIKCKKWHMNDDAIELEKVVSI